MEDAFEQARHSFVALDACTFDQLINLFLV